MLSRVRWVAPSDAAATGRTRAANSQKFWAVSLSLEGGKTSASRFESSPAGRLQGHRELVPPGGHTGVQRHARALATSPSCPPWSRTPSCIRGRGCNAGAAPTTWTRTRIHVRDAAIPVAASPWLMRTAARVLRLPPGHAGVPHAPPVRGARGLARLHGVLGDPHRAPCPCFSVMLLWLLLLTSHGTAPSSSLFDAAGLVRAGAPCGTGFQLPSGATPSGQRGRRTRPTAPDGPNAGRAAIAGGPGETLGRPPRDRQLTGILSAVLLTQRL